MRSRTAAALAALMLLAMALPIALLDAKLDGGTGERKRKPTWKKVGRLHDHSESPYVVVGYKEKTPEWADCHRLRGTVHQICFF